MHVTSPAGARISVDADVSDHDLRCPHCRAGEPSVWDGVIFHYAHPAAGTRLKFCHEPWRARCVRCSGAVDACACGTSEAEVTW